MQLVTMNYFVVREVNTKKYMISIFGHVSTRNELQEPTQNVVIRLFHSRKSAQHAIITWRQGRFSQDEEGDWDITNKPHRKLMDLEIIPVTITI